ncbi:MAG: cytochrome c biogenesis protein CcsA [Pseudomonadota bacterium]
MFVFTIFATYLGSAAALFTRFSDSSPIPSGRTAMLFLAGLAIAVHGGVLANQVILNPAAGIALSDVLSVIGWLFAVIGLFAALQPGFRALGGVVFAASALMLTLQYFAPGSAPDALSWQLKLHAMLSLLAYSFLAAGAILALASLAQDRQLRAAKVTRLSSLLPPLLATEEFLSTLLTAGFVFLLLSVTSGFVFIESLFTQHLTHKTVLSLVALAIFGVLVVGRRVAGWRGKRMLHLYLAAFVLLVLAYFGSKLVLEVILGESWG